MNTIKQISLFVALLSTIQCAQLDAHIARTATRFAQTVFRTRRNYSTAPEVPKPTQVKPQVPSQAKDPLAQYTKKELFEMYTKEMKSASRWAKLAGIIAGGGLGYALSQVHDGIVAAYEENMAIVQAAYDQHKTTAQTEYTSRKEEARQTLHGWIETVLGNNNPSADVIDQADAECPLSENLAEVIAAQQEREAAQADASISQKLEEEATPENLPVAIAKLEEEATTENNTQ